MTALNQPRRTLTTVAPGYRSDQRQTRRNACPGPQY